MGVRIIEDKDERMAVLYCSTTTWAFGPVFYEFADGSLSARDMAITFIRWLPQDARLYTQKELEDKHNEWANLNADEWGKLCAAVGVEE